jgi:anti-anti-sigma regulatory factor
MQLHEAILLAIENPARGIRIVRLAGDLDAAAGRRLAGVADVQLRRVAAEAADGHRSAHLLLDLASVRSFGPGGPEVLTGIRDQGRAQGVQVHLTGLSGRQLLLPGQVTNLLYCMSSYPTVECALQIIKREEAERPSAMSSPSTRRPPSPQRRDEQA